MQTHLNPAAAPGYHHESLRSALLTLDLLRRTQTRSTVYCECKSSTSSLDLPTQGSPRGTFEDSIITLQLNRSNAPLLLLQSRRVEQGPRNDSSCVNQCSVTTFHGSLLTGLEEKRQLQPDSLTDPSSGEVRGAHSKLFQWQPPPLTILPPAPSLILLNHPRIHRSQN